MSSSRIPPTSDIITIEGKQYLLTPLPEQNDDSEPIFEEDSSESSPSDTTAPERPDELGHPPQNPPQNAPASDSVLEKVSVVEENGKRIYTYRKPKHSKDGKAMKYITVKRVYTPQSNTLKRGAITERIITLMPPLTTPHERYRFYIEKFQKETEDYAPFTLRTFENMVARHKLSTRSSDLS